MTICAHMGIDAWYCSDEEMNHAWAAVKVKDTTGRTVLYLLDDGYAECIESAKDFQDSAFSLYIRGTKKAMGSAYPF